MRNKIDIEKIKLMLPDYLTGSLSEADIHLVESALDSSNELRQLCAYMKNALDFAGKIQVEEPAPQYWNNLLPRIHEKIEKRKKASANSPLTYVWKVLLPAAAVVLIFVVYRIVFTPDSQITQENNMIKEKVEKQDTVSKQIEKEIKQEPIDKRIPKEKSLVSRTKKQMIKMIPKEQDLTEITKQKENALEKEEIKRSNGNEDFASYTEVDELSIFGAGTPGTYDEDIENELDKLNSNEQDALLKELSNTNL
jgi:hypothetical protein